MKVKRSMLSTKTKKILAIVAFSLVFLATRIPFLGYDEINPDAVNWHLRSEQFIVGLKSGDLLKTYQHYHPGVTLMWIMGVPIELYRQVHPQDRVYTEDNFLTQHQIAKYFLVLTQFVLSVILIFALRDVLGFMKSLLATSLFSFEPWFLGNSRLLHMDVLLTLFVALALTYGYNYYVHRVSKYVVFSGFFAGLAFLTKSVGILAAGFVGAFLLVSAFNNRSSLKPIVRFLGMLVISTVVTIFTLFPALWVNPKFVLTDIYNEGLRIGTRRGHEQVLLGETVDAAGPEFYPIVLALKTSPVVWLGLGLFVFVLVKNRRRIQSSDKMFALYLTVFYLLYFIGMTVASKKIDRYMVPLFPWLGIMASIGVVQALNDVKGRVGKIGLNFSLALVTGICSIYPLISLYPYYFTYTNFIFGSANNANKIVGQKPFGIGIWELKNRLIEKHGKNVPLGFIDRKPMSMIYKNSQLFDIRETGTGKYDLIILGPNEKMPENVTDGKYSFIQDDAMYINGLEFWRIYKKVV